MVGGVRRLVDPGVAHQAGELQGDEDMINPLGLFDAIGGIGDARLFADARKGQRIGEQAVLGIIVAPAGGWHDAAIMRVVDAMAAIPWILLVMLFVVGLGSGTAALIPVLGFSYGLSVVYLARNAALDFVTRDFVAAAQARGESRWTVAIREVFPDIRDSLAVQGAMQWSWIFPAISSPSFLGMGEAPPAPDWGQMIWDARGIKRSAPWTVIWPMIFLSSLIIGVKLAVDAWAKARARWSMP